VGPNKVPTVFRIRILAKRFGRSFTPVRLSPTIGPDTPPAPLAQPDLAKASGDCDGNGVANDTQADDDSDGLNDDVELSLGLDPCKVDTDGDGVEDRWEFDCDRNGTLNRDQADDDSDLLDDSLEATLMTDPCSTDSDKDGVEDGYEYRSAIDLNDDEFQQPNEVLPYPGKRPYPNPLFKDDASVDHDGDGLTLADEHALWKYTYAVSKTHTRTLSPLSYTDGLQSSVYEYCTTGSSRPACGAGDENRRVPTLRASTYSKWFGAGGFLQWAQDSGYDRVKLNSVGPWWDHSSRTEYDLLDVNRDGVVSTALSDDPVEEFLVPERYMFDYDRDGYLSDDERDEDADGLSNFDELKSRMTPGYWEACYSNETPYYREFSATSHVDADSDGDGVRDGADDADGDDIPNIMELSRINASGLDDTKGLISGPAATICIPDPSLPPAGEINHPDEYGRVNPFNPCLPYTWARSCSTKIGFEDAWAPFDGSVNWIAIQ
jgi:hypothetical protein